MLIDGQAPGTYTHSIISYLPDKNYLNDAMKVNDLILFFADFYTDFDRVKANDMLDSLGIDPLNRLKTLSKGNQEKVQLILTMSRKAQLYVLDEPIAGVDPAARDYILSTILSNYSEDASVLLSTHLIADVERVLDEMMDFDICFLLLGSGEARYEDFMREAESRHRGRLCAYIGYNEELSHKVYAGADMLLMPSRFEPCGLSQMIAMRYGTVPVVRETGGLKDTVVPHGVFGDNGFTFAGYNAHELYVACCNAQDAYNNKENWKNLVRHCMECDFSWDVSAKSYEGLYNETANLW